jgi:2-polyprenyl-6-methoxyphenol hydroxylase-like FAD-dependent oxidoreductase
MELSARGVQCVLAEPRETVSADRPRAKTTSVRTMEQFRRWGIAERIREIAPVPVAWSQDVVFCTSLLGHEITRFHDCFGLAPRRTDAFAESGQQIAQPLVEQVLRDTLRQREHVTLMLGVRVTALVETDSQVDVMLAGPDGEQQIRARYVLGCDGSAGITRAAIGARYAGSADARQNINLVFRAPGLAAKVPHGPAVHYWVINTGTGGVLGRLDLDCTWFAGIAGIEADDADLRGLIQDLIGASISVDVVARDPWAARMLIADRFASDRVFLAGDAAHLNPPWGGHGYNTGVGDAVNIGWKLAAVLAGWAPATLLKSYDSERRGVAERTIEISAAHLRRAPVDLASPALTLPGPAGQAARTEAAGKIQRHKETEFHGLGLVLGYHYADSPIVAHEDSPYPADQVIHYQPTTRPGSRLPHAWRPDGRSLYDLLGPGYTLLLVDRDCDPALSVYADPAPLVRAAAAAGVPLTVADVAGQVGDQEYGAALVLVRPDQHVAWRGDSAPADPARLIDLIRGAYP